MRRGFRDGPRQRWRSTSADAGVAWAYGIGRARDRRRERPIPRIAAAAAANPMMDPQAVDPPFEPLSEWPGSALPEAATRPDPVAARLDKVPRTLVVGDVVG